ncbi:hypothetical protein [uncultured Alcanivorax sp.]|uniref:hypothetical protein n=1 Tax=uncultured Alcanivorax sp. TaxID=191215 RepID=UPI0025E969EC|nr:hypothetical protein [uncultured Alcanivorax sp.]
MTDDNRIKFNAAQAAAYTQQSVPSLYRKGKTLPGYPRPHKAKGKRASFWFKDELDAYAAQKGEASAELLNLALHCSEAAPGGPSGHPFIAAYLLAGGESLATLSTESDIAEARLQRIFGNRTTATDEEMAELFRVAATQVVYRERVLAEQLNQDPQQRHCDKFRRAALSLDKAHQLCFGRALLDYLLEEGRDDGTA